MNINFEGHILLGVAPTPAMKRHLFPLALLITTGLGATALTSPASVARAAPSPSPIGEIGEIAHLPCEIEITTATGDVVADGGVVPINTPAYFPLEVVMRISNTGTNDVFGITNEYVIHHKVRTSPPMPLTSETIDLPAGAAIARTFFVQQAMLTGFDDHIAVHISPDVEGEYLVSGPFPELPRRCSAHVDFALQIDEPF